MTKRDWPRPAVAFALALALAVEAISPPPAMAKGCRPGCVRLELVGPGATPPLVVPLCFSVDACWRAAPAAIVVAGEPAAVRVFWTDDAGNRVPPPQAAGALSVFFWRASADQLAAVAPFEFEDRDVQPTEIDLAPGGEVYAAAVRFASPGIWLGQVRPSGASPSTPWGSDPVPFVVLPTESPAVSSWPTNRRCPPS